MKVVFEYFREVRQELARVVWPKKEEVVKLTLIVVLFSAVVAIYLGALDFAFTKILEFLVSR